MRTLTSIRGNSQRFDGGAMFGNASKAQWSRWMEPDENNAVELASRAMLVREGDRRVLFEAGIGAFFEPRLRSRYGVLEGEHRLLDSLAAVGLTHEDIDVVVLSHLHFDHAGGLLAAWEADAPLRLLFPRAVFVVGRDAFARAAEPHPRDRASFIPGLTDLLAASGRLELVDGERARALGAGYRFHRSDGHTPGMLLTEVDMPGGPVLFAADLIPARAYVHAAITMGYDRFAEKLVDEKGALLGDLHARSGRLFYHHDPEVALSRIGRDANGRFHPVDAQAEIRDLDS